MENLGWLGACVGLVFYVLFLLARDWAKSHAQAAQAEELKNMGVTFLCLGSIAYTAGVFWAIF